VATDSDSGTSLVGHVGALPTVGALSIPLPGTTDEPHSGLSVPIPRPTYPPRGTSPDGIGTLGDRSPILCRAPFHGVGRSHRPRGSSPPRPHFRFAVLAPPTGRPEGTNETDRMPIGSRSPVTRLRFRRAIPPTMPTAGTHCKHYSRYSHRTDVRSAGTTETAPAHTLTTGAPPNHPPQPPHHTPQPPTRPPRHTTPPQPDRGTTGTVQGLVDPFQTLSIPPGS
jgi:hypothetical protein